MIVIRPVTQTVNVCWVVVKPVKKEMETETEMDMHVGMQAHEAYCVRCAVRYWGLDLIIHHALFTKRT